MDYLYQIPIENSHGFTKNVPYGESILPMFSGGGSSSHAVNHRVASVLVKKAYFGKEAKVRLFS